MKKILSKSLAVITALSFVLSFMTGIPFPKLDFAVNSSAATVSGDYSYELLADGTAQITDYTGSATELTIPSELDGYKVTAIGNLAFHNCKNLTSIIIPDSVTLIEDYAFSDCIALTNVTLSDSVTSIGEGAFSDCDSLVNITIPDSVTSIGEGAFESCSALTSINVNENNPNYKSIDGVLFNKNATEIIAYPCGKNESSYIIPDSVISVGNSAFFPVVISLT